MCQLPRRFKKDSFIIGLLNAIESKTGWSEKYGEIVITNEQMKGIPPRLHYPSRTEVNDAVGKTALMLRLYFSDPPFTKKEAQKEKELYEEIYTEIRSDIDYAAHALVSLAQIYAMRNNKIGLYLAITRQTVEPAMFNKMLWRLVIDVIIHIFLNQLNKRQLTAADMKKIMKNWDNVLDVDIDNLLFAKQQIQYNRVNLTARQDPVRDESNPWLHYFKQLKGEKKPH